MSHARPRAPRPSEPDRAAPAASWIEGPLLGFDTETTGVDPCRDRLVTAALVARGPRLPDGTRSQEVRTWLADPGVEIPEAATAVHGVSTRRARTEGRPAPEVLAEVGDRLVAAMSAGTPVVAFNGSYDLTLLEAEFSRHGLPTMRRRLGRELGPIADPLVMDRGVDRWRRGKRRLSDLCAVYGVEVGADLHTAEVDVTATLDVLEALVESYPRISRLPIEELVPWQAQAHRQWAQSFNEWLSRADPGRQGAQTSWPLPSS